MYLFTTAGMSRVYLVPRLYPKWWAPARQGSNQQREVIEMGRKLLEVYAWASITGTVHRLILAQARGTAGLTLLRLIFIRPGRVAEEDIIIDGRSHPLNLHHDPSHQGDDYHHHDFHHGHCESVSVADGLLYG